MSFSSQTFTLSQVLTSTQMNQVDSNIDAVRNSHKGSSAPGDLVAGVEWTDDTSSPWTHKVYDGADWIDLYEIDSTGNTSTWKGAVNGTTGTFSGAVSATTGTFSGVLSVDDTTQSTSSTTGSIHTDGGLGVAKDIIGAGNMTLSGTGGISLSSLTASFSVGTFDAGGSSDSIEIQSDQILSVRNTTATSTRIRFYNPNGSVGSITTTSTATAFNTSSDPRLKSEFMLPGEGKVWDAFQSIYDSFGVFHFLTDPDIEVWGFDAHKAIDSGLGFASEGDGPRDAKIDGKLVTPASVDMSKVVPYLVATIESLNRRLEALGG